MGIQPGILDPEHRPWEGSGPPWWTVRFVGIQVFSNFTNICLFVVTVLHYGCVVWFNQCPSRSLGDVTTQELDKAALKTMIEILDVEIIREKKRKWGPSVPPK